MQVSGIQIWGDSLFRGVQFDSERGRYVIAPHNPVDKASLFLDIPTKNHARMGNTVLQGYEGLQKAAPESMQNQLVILEFGGNDCDFCWSEVAKAPAQGHTCYVPPDLYKETLQKMIAHIRKAGGTPILTTLPPLDAEKYFRWITKGIDANGVLAFLGDIQQIYRWQEYYSLMNLDMACTKGLLCLPLRETILSKGPHHCWMCEDGIHPNDRGHEYIYEVFISQWKRSFAEAV